eukprot:scaffold4418_cov33-Phaeocystis_antarctica.AAC.1
MVPLRLSFSQLLYDAIYLDLPPPFSVPPVTLLVAVAAAVGMASADELLSEEPFADTYEFAVGEEVEVLVSAWPARWGGVWAAARVTEVYPSRS